MRPSIIAAAAVAALGLSSAASAATLINATTISITNAFNTYLQVAEVQAFSGVNNVALAANGGTAAGGATYDVFSSADKAIDGNTGGDYYSDTIYHGLGDGGSTLTISFAATNLNSLTIFGRTDCCSNRDLYNVTISGANGVLFSGQIEARGAAGTVSFVPEPATWALMIGGFAMTGFAARRRRVSVTA